jgi:hypothetical protein
VEEYVNMKLARESTWEVEEDLDVVTEQKDPLFSPDRLLGDKLKTLVTPMSS